jgi:hypothetical protein
MQIRYHLDESVANAVAQGLRRRGIDVTTAHDAGLIGATDEQHLAFALPEGRVCVSHDSDFLKLDHEGIAHAGVAYCAPRHRTVGQIVNRLTDLWRTRTAEVMSGEVEFL